MSDIVLIIINSIWLTFRCSESDSFSPVFMYRKVKLKVKCKKLHIVKYILHRNVMDGKET